MYLLSVLLAFTLAEPHHDIRRAYFRLLSETAGRDTRLRTQSFGPSADFDSGNIAVIHDDGTLITPINLFDLANHSLIFTPSGAGYTVAPVSPAFDAAAAMAGQKLTLKDDDSALIALGFPFPFYAQIQSNIFLNSDGNLTFGAGDVAVTPRDLGRVLAGPPRLAPFFQDLNPAEGGTVTVNVQGNRAVFTWTAVPLCCVKSQPNPAPTQTFQVILSSDGTIQYNYGAVQGREAVVAISPGGAGILPAAASPVHFSSLQTATPPTSNAITEVFAASSGFCLSCFGQRFYASHEDAYDQIVIFSTFNYSLSAPGAFSESNPIRNDVTGIGGLDNSAVVFDGSRLAGSRGRIQSIVEMGSLPKFPSDPTAGIPSLGEHTGLSVTSHEIGHRWLAYARYPYNGDSQSDLLLGRDDQHWSFFFNTLASFLEGNQWSDNGNGSFTSLKAVSQYSPLDRYLMGLIAAEQVADSFVITNPFGFYNSSSAPATGAMVTGTRTNVTMAEFIRGNGPRLPPVAMSQKTFNFAFVLLTAAGSAPSAADISKVDTYRTQLEAYWNQATGGTGTIHTNLLKAAQILPLPFAAGSVTTTVNATLHLQSPAGAGGATFQLQSTNPASVKVPNTVVVPAGANDAPFMITMGIEGASTITATSPGYETIAGAAASTNGAAVNGASFAAGYPVSPGSIASFFGPFLTNATAEVSTLPLPTTLAGVMLNVNGVKAPLFYVSPGQVNFQVPFETYGSYATLVVNRNGQAPLNVPLMLDASAPGLFAGGILDAVTLGKVTTAHAGQFLALYATGLGAVNPTPSSGTGSSDIPPLSRLVDSAQVTIGGQNAPVTFAGLAPGFVGLYQVNIQVPPGVTGTGLPVVVTVSARSSNALTLNVQ